MITRLKLSASLVALAFLACSGETTVGPPPSAELRAGCALMGWCDEPLEDLCPGCSGVFNGWSADVCFGGAKDLDGDGFHDSCETALAQSFAPEFVFSLDCNWDDDLNRMGGEYYYAVKGAIRPLEGIRVARIAYLPAYYMDCGSASSSEVGNWFDDPHSGDSEFIVVDASFDSNSNHWRTEYVFLSAHFGAPDWEVRDFDRSDWYFRTAFDYVNPNGLGAPVVWVSLAKHANYPTEAMCDDAFLGLEFDTCTLGVRRRFPVQYVGQNFGSRAHPLVWWRDELGNPAASGCVGPQFFWGSSMVDDDATECMWKKAGRFNGWQGQTWGVAPSTYGKILLNFGF